MITTVNLSKEVINHSKNNNEIFSLSGFVEEQYRRVFFKKDYLEKRKQNLENELQEINKLMQDIDNNEEEPQQIIDEEQEKWLREKGLDRIERTTIKGVYNFFVNHFDSDISYRDFRIIVDKIKAGKPINGGKN